ncbi:GntR family transcriptional regulator [Clostridium sp. UBA6640]|uniref:GntR family transcriptional regulator n=1 Tax=Clostridium sp. UBA6640 TaxID=1946370 RepID=UPI0025C1A2D8|nr:GntR family transcriptional regulator [Clostridium sp. UBA6640]
MNIIISNSSSQPIYEQIANQVKAHIINGVLQPGEVLPSIRNLAKELQISVITTKRAYEELEKEGFVETVGGKGTFVSGQNSEFIREKRLKELEEKITEVVQEGKALNISAIELKEMIDLVYEEE